MLIRIISIIVLSTILIGCSGNNSWIRDRAKDYERTECATPLKIPAGMSAEVFTEDYQIP